MAGVAGTGLSNRHFILESWIFVLPLFPADSDSWQDFSHAESQFPRLWGQEVGVEMVFEDCPISKSVVLKSGQGDAGQH